MCKGNRFSGRSLKLVLSENTVASVPGLPVVCILIGQEWKTLLPYNFLCAQAGRVGTEANLVGRSVELVDERGVQI